jgi:hypothetical protein
MKPRTAKAEVGVRVTTLARHIMPGQYESYLLRQGVTMANMQKRLDTLEEWRILQNHRKLMRELAGRSEEETQFLLAHGYWPEAAGNELPLRQEFTAGGIKTVVTTEWAKEGTNE